MKRITPEYRYGNPTTLVLRVPTISRSALISSRNVRIGTEPSLTVGSSLRYRVARWNGTRGSSCAGGGAVCTANRARGSRTVSAYRWVANSPTSGYTQSSTAATRPRTVQRFQPAGANRRGRSQTTNSMTKGSATVVFLVCQLSLRNSDTGYAAAAAQTNASSRVCRRSRPVRNGIVNTPITTSSTPVNRYDRYCGLSVPDNQCELRTPWATLAPNNR